MSRKTPEMKRSRRVGVPRYQKLFLTSKMQKVTAAQRWTKKLYIEKIPLRVFITAGSQIYIFIYGH